MLKRSNSGTPGSSYRQASGFLNSAELREWREEFYVEAGTGRKYRHAPTADGRGGKVLPAVVCGTGMLPGRGFSGDASTRPK